MRSVIQFQKTPLAKLAWNPWGETGFVGVEFFPGSIVSVRVTSVLEPIFANLLRWVDDGRKLMLDLEWRPDEGENHLPCIFQIGSTRGVLIIRHPPELPADQRLKQFLSTHDFYMKGMVCDSEKLKLRFGKDFPLNRFEDIEQTLLIPRKLPLNFSRMVKQCARAPPCDSFKNKEITVSNWEQPMLTKGQVLYAAFDVVALAEVIAGIRQRDHR